jgi:glycerol-3-phosphate dehydrogenase subunit C
MTTHLYDPLDPSYFDDVDARAERNRAFQICSDCRICVRLCPSFKDLFHMIDERDDGAQDVAFLAAAQHTQLVDECYQCKLCFVICPYTPERGQDWKIDVPRLMLRTAAINAREGHLDRSARLLARTDLQGRVATTIAPVVNRMNDLRPARALIEKTTGIARDRLLPTYAREKFSKWFLRRTPAQPQAATVALFPTCMVEYQEPSIGQAVVGVCERNGITCELPEGQICCGMPWLDAGDVAKFEEHARRNVDALIHSVRAGRDVIVPQPTYAYVLKNEVPDFLGTDDARLVAEHTFDVSEYLMMRHRERPLDTNFPRIDLRDHHLARGVPLPGSADRAQERRPDGPDRGHGHHGRAMQRHRRNLGPARPEHRDGPPDRATADGRGAGGDH